MKINLSSKNIFCKIIISKKQKKKENTFKKIEKKVWKCLTKTFSFCTESNRSSISCINFYFLWKVTYLTLLWGCENQWSYLFYINRKYENAFAISATVSCDALSSNSIPFIILAELESKSRCWVNRKVKLCCLVLHNKHIKKSCFRSLYLQHYYRNLV